MRCARMKVVNSANFDGIVVIQCAGSKQPEAGTFMQNGLPVKFVAHPNLAADDGACIYAHPDDSSVAGNSWRDKLLNYNERHRKSNENPFRLLQAGQLYTPPAPYSEIYRDLVRKYTAKHVYILSAGWGLISACFLVPDYDITFSYVKCKKWVTRGRRDLFADFLQISNETKVPIVCFGGEKYIRQFHKQTQSFDCQKIVFHKSVSTPRESGYEYRRYKTTTRNWHYECALRFMQGEFTI